MTKISERNKGIFFILCAAFFFSLMSVFVHLAGDLPAMQKALFRNMIALIVSSVMLFRSGEKLSVPKNARFDLLMRAAFGTIGLTSNFYAIDHLSLSDANMLNKLSPFFAILASVHILKEKASAKDWLTLILAFLGALLVMKPGSGINGFPALVGFTGGVASGFAYTFLRKLGKKGVKAPIIIFAFSVVSTVIILPVAIAGFQSMTLKQTLLLLLAGCSATGGQFSVTAAYTHAPAKEISVFDYTQILFAALFGFVFFDQLPDTLSVLGYIIVIGAAVIRFLQNRKTA